MHFNRQLVAKVVSVILLFEGLAMIIPFICALYYEEYHVATALFCTMSVCIVFGESMRRVIPTTNKWIRAREGYLFVITSWFFVVLLGAMPYFLSDLGYNFIDCLFESCAGWTTTGCSVFDADIMPRSLLLWKAVTSWFGGMGIILLTISIFPRLGIGGQKMAAAETPGPELDKLTARYGDTAKTIYRVYIALTILEFLLLMAGGTMTPYGALLNTLSTVSTAGIASLEHTQTLFVITPYVKCIMTIFSLAGGISFMIYFLLSARRYKEAISHHETRRYLMLILSAGLVVSLSLYKSGVYDSLYSAFGNGLSETVAFATTTGFTVGNISTWPTVAKVILICLAMIGGCGFSTSGGIKVIRFIVFFKLILRGLYKRIHPNAIRPVMVQGRPVSARTVSAISGYIMLYLALFMFSALVVSLDNFDMETTLSAVLATMSTNGVMFGLLTSSDFSIFSQPIKLYLMMLMIAGRLEIHAIVIMFSRSYWNSDRARS